MSIQIERCLAVLERLADDPDGVSLSRLADRLGLPKAAAYRLLGQLAELGYVRQDDVSQRYALTMRLPALGFRYLAATRLDELCQPSLENLARRSGEHARLAVVDGERLIWVANAQGAAWGLRYVPQMGREVVLHRTATGKAWLATMSDEEALRLVYAQGFGERADDGPNTVHTVEALLDELAATRARGHGLAADEGEPGVTALATTVPGETGRPVATVSVAGPSFRMGPERRGPVHEALDAAASELAGIWPMRRRHVRGAAA